MPFYSPFEKGIPYFPPLKKGVRGIYRAFMHSYTMHRYRGDLKYKARQLRKNMTESERVLWSRVRGKQLSGIQFYRQKPIGDYIVDFYAPKAKLVLRWMALSTRRQTTPKRIRPSISAPRKRTQKPAYCKAVSGAAGGGAGVTDGTAGSAAETKTEPQLAQKRASEGFSYPQLVHFN